MPIRDRNSIKLNKNNTALNIFPFIILIFTHNLIRTLNSKINTLIQSTKNETKLQNQTKNFRNQQSLIQVPNSRAKGQQKSRDKNTPTWETRFQIRF